MASNMTNTSRPDGCTPRTGVVAWADGVRLRGAAAPRATFATGLSFHDSPHPDETNGDAKVQHVRDEAPRTPMVRFGEHNEQEIDGGGHAAAIQQPRKQESTHRREASGKPTPINQTPMRGSKSNAKRRRREPLGMVTASSLRYVRPNCVAGFGALWRGLRCQCSADFASRLKQQCLPCRSCAVAAARSLCLPPSNDSIKTQDLYG